MEIPGLLQDLHSRSLLPPPDLYNTLVQVKNSLACHDVAYSVHGKELELALSHCVKLSHFDVPDYVRVQEEEHRVILHFPLVPMPSRPKQPARKQFPLTALLIDDDDLTRYFWSQELPKRFTQAAVASRDEIPPINRYDVLIYDMHNVITHPPEKHVLPLHVIESGLPKAICFSALEELPYATSMPTR